MSVPIALKNVTVSYGKHRAISDVNLDVGAGELLALLGPSGCGKTTLLRTIAGLEPVESGHIFFEKREITREPISRRTVGFVFQSYALFPHLNVYENVAFGLKNRGVSRARIAERVGEMLELVGLLNHGLRFPAQLSGGQRQRVAFARALAVAPEILLLDEPFAALDLRARKELRRWVRDLHEKTHVTSILVTHDPDEALEIADRIALIESGEIVQIGTPDELYASSSSPFARRFPIHTCPHVCLQDCNQILAAS